MGNWLPWSRHLVHLLCRYGMYWNPLARSLRTTRRGRKSLTSRNSCCLSHIAYGICHHSWSWLIFFLWGLCTPTVGSLLSLSPAGLQCPHPSTPPALMLLPVLVPLSRESEDRPQAKGWVLRMRSNRAQRQDQDESFIWFYLAFQAWIVGVTAGGQGSQEGTTETWWGWGRGGRKAPVSRLGPEAHSWSWGAWRITTGPVSGPQAWTTPGARSVEAQRLCPVWMSWQPAKTGV